MKIEKIFNVSKYFADLGEDIVNKFERKIPEQLIVNNLK